MRGIAFCVLLILWSVSTKAQFKEGDRIIGQDAYNNLTSFQKKYLTEKSAREELDRRVDSLFLVLEFMAVENTTLKKRNESLESQLVNVTEDNRKNSIRAKAYREKLNESQFIVRSSPRFKEKANMALVWAGFTTMAFFMSLSDDDNVKKTAYIGMGMASVATVTVYILLNKKQKTEQVENY